MPRREKPTDVAGFATTALKDWRGHSYAADRVAVRFAQTWGMTDDTKGRFVTVDWKHSW